MIKNYIFDLGQVIVRFDPAYMTGVYIKDREDAELAQKIIFDRLYWDKLDDGSITDSEVKEAVCKRLPEKLHSEAVKVYDNWYRNMPFTEGIVSLINEIKDRGGRLFLLSNVSEGFAENYDKVPELSELFSKFDGLVFSGTIRLIKPDIEIFEHILKKYSLKADECVFIDDNVKNVEGSRAAGIEAYHFDGDVLKLRNWLFSGDDKR